MAWEYILCSLAVTSLALGVPPEENCTKDNKYCQPEQVHIAFGEKSNDITVTWSTMNNTYGNEIDFINRSALKQMRLYITKFVDGGDEHHFQFIHTIILKDLDHDQLYVYKVGSQYGLSEKYSFRIPPKGDNYPVRALFFGDMGIPWGKQRKTLQALINEVKCRHYDVAVHNGDFAYDLGTDNAHHGDKFMNMIQPLAANIPYMTSPGNHEGAYNFSNYKNRFFMPGHSENMFYSFNLGPVHFVAVNTETYFRWQSRPSPSRGNIPEVAINGPFKEEVQRHFNWLKADLEEAAKKENREKRPWIILFGHRPMYCSSSNFYDQCRDGNKDRNYPNRGGIPEFGGLGMEPLLKEYGVDLVIWAHEHFYERTWPLYNGTVYNGTERPYVNPGAPVHVTTGAAGNKEGQDGFYKDPHGWSAFRSSDYGYARLFVYNATHLHMEEVSTDDAGVDEKPLPKTIDEFWLIKTEHKPYDISFVFCLMSSTIPILLIT